MFTAHGMVKCHYIVKWFKMLGKGKLKFLEDMIKSLAISVEDLTSKVELLRQEVKELKAKRKI